jgi:5'-nucleotidase
MATTGWSRSSTSDGVRIMKILVTNDDGIDSPGIQALADAVSRVGQVLIVAPAKEQSGVGTAVSLHNGIAAAERTSAIE